MTDLFAMDDVVKKKLIESCYAIKLSTGELLVGIATRENEFSVNVNHPYELLDDSLIPYIEYAFDRSLCINLNQTVFIKRVSAAFASEYFMSVLVDDLDGFKEFMTVFVASMLAATTSDERTLH